MDRRDFVHRTAWSALGAGLLPYLGDRLPQISLPEDVADEKAWQRVARCWPDAGADLMMNHARRGQPLRSVAKSYAAAAKDRLEHAALPPSADLMCEIKHLVAAITRLSTDHLAVTHNATTALVTAIRGVPLTQGDEVIIGRYDYPTMYQAWQQRAHREGIVLREVDVCGAEDEKAIIARYSAAVTARTRAIHLTDVVHSWGGQVPTAAILQGMPDHVRYRIVDVAQRVGHMQDDLSKLGATHIGFGLHKWLMAPASIGILYVRPDHVAKTEALYGCPGRLKEHMGKFDIIGATDSWALAGAIAALAVYEQWDSARLHGRLMHLSDRLRQEILSFTHLSLLSPQDQPLKTAIVAVAHHDLRRREFYETLTHQRIHTSLMNHGAIRGLRLSPGLMTTAKDIDRVIAVLAR